MEEEGAAGTGLGDLDAGSIVPILALLSPRDVARLALVSTTFFEASRSDAVWEKMLPPHWQDVAGDALNLGAMRIYEQLSVFVEEDKEDKKQQLYWVDRPTGGVCNMFSARALGITWGEDDRYWDWRSMNGSRFEEVAFLKQVCWFEIRGGFNGYLRRGKYTVSFRLQLLRSSEERGDDWYEEHGDDWYEERGDDWYEDAYGWEEEPVIFQVSTGDGQAEEHSRYLTSNRDLAQEGLQNLAVARIVEDGWTEYDAGEFVVEDEDNPVKAEF